MDWKTLRFDWNRARAFLVTAEEGSFSAAARALDLTQPTVGRQVAALEEELGVLLFERVGNGLELTQAGLALLEHTRHMGEAATSLSLAATGRSSSLQGVISITSSAAIAAFILPGVVARLRQNHPGIEVELVVSNEIRDLRRREADIAVRHVRPKDASLIAQFVREGRASLYASPSYLAGVSPNALDPAARLDLFAFDQGEEMLDALKRLGLEADRARFPIRSDDHLVQWEMCKRGLGACFMLAEVGDAEPLVERVWEHASIPLPIWVVCHQELRHSRRLRVVFDLLKAHLARST